MKSNSKIRILAIVLLIVFACSILTGCSKKQESAQDSSDEAESIVLPEAGEEIHQLNMPFFDISYKVPYKDCLVLNEAGEGAEYSANAKCLLGSMEIPMFKLYFSAEPDENTFGSIENDDETLYVCLSIADDEPEGLPEDAEEVLCAMEETVNDLIKEIRNGEGFTPEKPVKKSADEQTNSIEAFAVETPYTNVMVRTEYAEHLRVEESGEGTNYKAEFICCVEDEEILLYTLSFSTKSDGSFAKVNAEDNVYLFVEVNDSDSQPELGEDSLEILQILEESVNGVISDLRSNPDLTV